MIYAGLRKYGTPIWGLRKIGVPIVGDWGSLYGDAIPFGV